MSALSYSAFIDEWKKKMPIDSAYTPVFKSETSSLEFSFDKLKPFQPRIVQHADGELASDIFNLLISFSWFIYF